MADPFDSIDGDELDDDLSVVELLEQYIAAGFNTVGPQGSSNPEYKTLQAYLRQIFGPLPEGAVDWQASDLNGDGVNDLYAVDADGNPHTVYGYDDDGETESTAYSDYLRDTVYGGTTPTTWDDIVKILKAEGYDDEAIEEVRGSIKCLTNANEIQCGENEKFQGSVVLAGILNNSGYDGSWWDVRPTAGQPCQTDDGKQGEYDTNGNCNETEEPADGTDCEYAVGIPGKIENGECTFIVGAECTEGSVPGTVDSAGKCDTGDDGVVDCDANPNDPECIDKSFQDYVDEVGEDIANTAKGIYDDFKDVITDCAGNPLECIKKIGDKIAEAGIPEKCQDLKTCQEADPDKGTYCWKDCVNFNVLIGIPGLPQLPGMGEIDVGTYRDFEEFLKGIGKDIGDFMEDPAGTLEGWKDAVLKKVKEIFGDATDTKVNDIVDWLKGIFGVYAATWIWGELEEEITNLLPIAPVDEDCPEDVSEINADNFERCGYQDCGEGKYVKVGESCGDPFDETKCVEEDYFNENQDACVTAGYVNCTGGENSSGQETTGGIIKGIVDDCDVIQDPQCIGDGVWDGEKCVCPDGTDKAGEEEPLDGDCSDGGNDTCDNNAVDFDDCNDCGDGTTPDQHINDDCNENLKDGGNNDKCPNPDQVRRGGIAGGECVTPGQPCFAEPNKYPGDSTTTNQGKFNTEGFCTSVSEGQCTNGNTPEYLPEDTDQDGAFFYGGDSITYDPCANDLPSSMYFTPAPELVCNDENADPPEGDDGGCGPCKSGFEFDEGEKKCVSKGEDPGTDETCEEGDELETKQWAPDDPDKDGIVVDSEGQSYSYDPCNPSLGYTPIDDPDTDTGTPGEECTMEIPAFYAPSCSDAPMSTVSGVYDENGECKPTRGLPCTTVLSNCEPTSNGVVRRSQYSESGYACEGIKEQEGCDEGYDKPEGYDECTSIAQLCADEAKGYGPDDAPCKDIEPEVTCQDPNATNYEQEGECGPCKDLYDRPEGYDECVLIETLCQDPQYAEGNELCQGPCDDGEVEFVAQNGEIFCDAPCAYNDQIASSSPDCVDPVCKNGATDYPDCVTCPSGQRINPETDKCEEVDCTDSANALICGWVECDDGTMAPTLGDCDQPTPCSDPEYAAAHPLECGWVECPDGSFAETRDECEEVTCDNGATDYPDCTVCPEGSSMDAEGTCVGVTPPPPETGGGGGGGGGGMFNPFLAGISYTPQAVPEPPAPAQKDYMAELDNIIKRSLFEGMA
jgi:hypothetical protein